LRRSIYWWSKSRRRQAWSAPAIYRLLKSFDLITSPAFIVIKAADEFRDKTTAINQLWQTDFTYLKAIGWGWMYLSTILDDYSRYILAWKLCTTMKTSDVTDTLTLALQASGCDQAPVAHKPRLLSDNGSSYVSAELSEWLDDKNMGHVRGAPYHPQTQGKIERWHQTLKNRILLDNYFFPADLEAQIERFVDHYNHRRYHESINNLAPADVYFGRGQSILKQRQRIKRKTMETRRLQYRKYAAQYLKPDEPDPLLDQDASCADLYDDGQSTCPLRTQTRNRRSDGTQDAIKEIEIGRGGWGRSCPLWVNSRHGKV
jgi:putative transposase